MKKLCIIFLLLFLNVSCSLRTCRYTSIQDARQYEKKGYKTRIAIYKQGILGKLWGAGIWEYHAQAQIQKDNEWYWIGMIGLPMKSPSFSIVNNEVYYWHVDEYEKLLKDHGKYY